MRTNQRTIYFYAVVVLLLCAVDQAAQTSGAGDDTNAEFWPAIKLNLDVRPRVRLQITAERQNGEEVANAQWKQSAIISFRIKPIFNPLARDVDSDNQYVLSVGLGYEHIRKESNGQSSHEHRVMFDSTPRYSPFADILIQNRNRLEFRWLENEYDFRYRNKLIVQRAFKTKQVEFTPYATGELFWDRKFHAWNQNQYAFGVQVPVARRFMIDSYYLKQNCNTCSNEHVNAIGLTLNIFLKLRR